MPRLSANYVSPTEFEKLDIFTISKYIEYRINRKITEVEAKHILDCSINKWYANCEVITSDIFGYIDIACEWIKENKIEDIIGNPILPFCQELPKEMQKELKNRLSLNKGDQN